MVRCFNCQTTEGVGVYSFDMDLPAVTACAHCIFALGQGDDDLLDALKPRGKRPAARTRRRTTSA